jgi:uncharacterized protein (TIGR02231 family)
MNFLLLTLFLSANILTPTDSISVSSSINEVTVFRQQAQIERKAEVNLEEGKNIIVFKRLTPTLDQKSIQLKASGKFSVNSITQRYDYFSDQRITPEIQLLENQRDSLKHQITFLESDLNVLQNELQLLESTVSNINNKELTAAELTQFLDLYRKRAGKLKGDEISINESLKKKNHQLNKVLSQINDLKGNQQSRFSEIIAEVSSKQPQTLTFTLSYLAGSAGWVPSYDIRSEDITKPLNISYKADVYQNTGIDWNDVQITINSGNPSVNVILPDLSPSYVDFIRRDPISANPQALRELVVTAYSKSESAKQDEMALEAEAPITEFNQNQTSFSYKISTSYTIPSDGKAKTIEVNRTEVETAYSYSTVPKLSNHAYLIGEMSNWDNLNLIAGDGNVYFENNFIGTTRLNPNSFDDTLSVSLGRDESIIIERNKLRDFEERNFFGNKVREKNAWEINIRNTKSESISISVQDQIPLSRNEDINVEATRLSGGILNKQTGIVTWKINIEPNATHTIRFDYQVEYPSGERIRY